MAGFRLIIPVIGKKRREQALKAVEEMCAKILADLAQFRQAEADLAACETRLSVYIEQSTWRQQRVPRGCGAWKTSGVSSSRSTGCGPT